MAVVSPRILQRRIAQIERPTRSMPDYVPSRHPGIDQALGGGFMRGRVHELFAPPSAEAVGAMGFAAALLRLLNSNALWLREQGAERCVGQLSASGLAEIGLDPSRLLLGVLPDATAVLRAATDGLRCNALGGTVIEVWGNRQQVDLTASRRLALAAEASGVMAILLRAGGSPAPSAAQTRWRVAPAPSRPLPAEAPGWPAWQLELLRQRGGPAGGIWHVEWDREQAALRDRHDHAGAALLGRVASLSSDGSPRAWRHIG